jgi:antirestriction protein ArdC
MKVYEKITGIIMEKLEQGVAPWRKPWTASGFPKNLTTKKEYRGINLFLLHLSSFESPFWLTFKQAKSLGGRVKKGEKSMPVVFWTTKTVDEADAENGETRKKEISILKFYSVFNAEQCDGLKDVPPPVERQIDKFTRILVPSKKMNHPFGRFSICQRRQDEHSSIYRSVLAIRGP